MSGALLSTKALLAYTVAMKTAPVRTKALPGPTRLLTQEDVAERLGISRFSVIRLLNNGDLAYTRATKKLRRVTEEQLADFIRRRTVSKQDAA